LIQLLTPMRAIASVLLKRLWRSRLPIALGVLVLALCYYDHVQLSGSGRGNWWAVLALVGPWSGFLASYDLFERLHAEGALRPLLLRGVSRWQLALGAVLASGAVVVAAVLMTGLYLALSGRAPIRGEALAALAAALVGGIAAAAFWASGSLLLPRDAGAVAGILLLTFSANTPSRWLPMDLPAFVQNAVRVFWSCIPGPGRIDQLMQAQHSFGDYALLVVIGVFAVLAAQVLLGRRAWLRRPRSGGDA